MITVEQYMNGYSIQYIFENGLNFSMVQHDGSYSDNKSVEIAILDQKGEFITKDFIDGLDDDVKGWVSADEASEVASKVKEWTQ